MICPLNWTCALNRWNKVTKSLATRGIVFAQESCGGKYTMGWFFLDD